MPCGTFSHALHGNRVNRFGTVSSMSVTLETIDWYFLDMCQSLLLLSKPFAGHPFWIDVYLSDVVCRINLCLLFAFHPDGVVLVDPEYIKKSEGRKGWYRVVWVALIRQ